MGVPERLFATLIALAAATGAALGQVANPPAPSQAPSSSGASTSQKHRTHHTTIEETEAASPDLTKAEELIQKKSYPEAQPLLQKAVQADPENYVAWFDLGFVENELGHTNESIAAYRKSVAAKPDVFESNLNLGLQLAKSGQPDAEQFLRAATQLKPTSRVNEGKARAWLSLGHVLESRLGAPIHPTTVDDALGAYHQAEALAPKDPEPHLSAGLLLEKEDKFADAEAEYKQALQLDPASLDAVTGLANIYMRGRRFPEAESELRKVVAAHPESAAAHIQLGRVLAAEGKNDDAIVELNAGAKLAPADPSLQRDLADLYFESGKNAEAESAYRALLASHPTDPDLHRRLGESLLRQKKFPEAQQEFLASVKIKPDSSEAYGDLAFAASENKDYPLVIKALDARVKFAKEIPITYFLRATALDHLLDVKNACANYHLFLQAADGKYPDQEWQARHRLIALEKHK